MINEDSLQKRNAAILPHLDERQRRLFAAAEAKAAGYGGIAAVSRVTRIAASTIGRGLKDIEAPDSLAPGRVRRAGGGRNSLTKTDPRLLDDLNALVEPDARGDPMSSLRWTCKSLRRLAAELNKLGHQISHTVVGELLKAQKFSLQANRKTREGADNPDRDAQFGFINEAVTTAMAQNQPVISVDTKKKGPGWGFQEPRARMAAARRARGRARARLSDQGAGTRRALWNLRSGRQHGLGERRRRQRYGGVRRADDPTMVARGRPRSLSPRPTPTDHRRWRRQQWLARASVET
jgi:hypothetical protein